MKNYLRYYYLYIVYSMIIINTIPVIWAQDHDPSFFLERSRSQNTRTVIWKPEKTFRFDNPSEITECPIPEGKWEVDNGTLRAIGGDRNRAILLHRNVGDPVCVEFDVTNYADGEGRLGDITVLLNSVDGKAFFGHGYALTTASYWNNCTTFYKRGKPIARTEYTPVVSGKTYHVILEFNNGHIRYWLDDRIILEAWDERPLEIDSECWIGIRTWSTLMVVDNVVVKKR
ncbi:MAG: hypothetical protein JXB48_19205 [Candidatus Latescibacteria bacterium]|nr:hypothetical protein [Candidatus Latescibacterota bacterium]